MFASTTELRVRAGLVSTDASKDTELVLSRDVAIALAESFCDRKFPYQGDLEEFIHKDGHYISLRRYPVETIGNISGSKNKIKYHLDKENGILHLDENIHEHELKISYNGGYKDGEYPGDLLLAFYILFDSVWDNLKGGGGSSTVVAGAIQSVTIPDVGTVRFASGASAAAAASGAGGDYLTPTVMSILNNYRRELC